MGPEGNEQRIPKLTKRALNDLEASLERESTGEFQHRILGELMKEDRPHYDFLLNRSKEFSTEHAEAARLYLLGAAVGNSLLEQHYRATIQPRPKINIENYRRQRGEDYLSDFIGKFRKSDPEFVEFVDELARTQADLSDNFDPNAVMWEGVVDGGFSALDEVQNAESFFKLFKRRLRRD